MIAYTRTVTATARVFLCRQPLGRGDRRAGERHDGFRQRDPGGALQDTGTAIVVGNKPLQGVVQTVYTFPEDGAGMQLTTARYYTSGRSIHGVGIQPDIKVSLDAEHEILSAKRIFFRTASFTPHMRRC